MDASLAAVRPFGFDFCGWRTNPFAEKNNKDSDVVAFNTVEDKALEKISRGEYDKAPVPRHCAHSQSPIAWRGTTEEDIFFQCPTLLEEYYGTGHRSGWAISTAAHECGKGIFFVESKNILSLKEIMLAEQHMLWVSAAAYIRLEEVKKSSSELSISLFERDILKKLYQYNASLKEMLLDSRVNAVHIISVVDNLRNKFGCNSLHSLVAHALFLGLIE